MEETKNTTQETAAPQKPSYEELNDYCNQLMMQNRQLSQRLNQVMDAQNSLPYLFEVAKNPDIFGIESADACVERIKLMILPHKKEDVATDSAEDNTETKED